jgi:transcriptional regulator with XRE-family HTH domain
MPASKKNPVPTARVRASRRVDRAPHLAFGQRLASFRTAAGLTQSQLADRLGVSRRQIAYYESGTGRPPGALLAMLADLFEVSTDVLLGRAAPAPPAGRLSRSLLEQLNEVERLGRDSGRRLERVISQFIAEEKRRHAPSRRATPKGAAAAVRRAAR